MRNSASKQGQDVEIAVVVNHGVAEEVWIPISQISDWCDGPDDAPGYGTTSIFIPEWMAQEKGMI